MGITEIATLARAISQKHNGQYVAMCDYYGTFDEVHVMVALRRNGFSNGELVLNTELELSGQFYNESEVFALIKKLQGLLDE